MGLMDFILEDKNKTTKKVEQKKEVISFPNNNGKDFKVETPINDGFKMGVDPITSDKGSLGWPITPESSSCEPYMESVVNLYEKGFDGLNKAGYDFYEFYKAIMSAGADNSAMYLMALNMAKAMDPSVSKENLLKQADYYLAEIEKVHDSYVTQGKGKRNTILGEKAKEEASLKEELLKTQNQLQQLRQRENELKIQVGAVDNKYASQLHDTDCKLQANDQAKEALFATINKVKQGINTNL